MSAETLGRSFASTGAVRSNVSVDQLDDPTPCASWTVRDLVNHIVGGAAYFAATAEHGAAPSGGDTPDFAAGDFNAAFAEDAAHAVAAFSAEGAMERAMWAPFGELPGSMFVLVASVDTFTHGWDLAKATGQSTDLDPPLAAKLLDVAKMGVSDSMRGPEPMPIGIAVEVPEDAPAADRLAGFLGRHP